MLKDGDKDETKKMVLNPGDPEDDPTPPSLSPSGTGPSPRGGYLRKEEDVESSGVGCRER